MSDLNQFDMRPAVRCMLLRSGGEGQFAPIARGFLVVLLVQEHVVANGRTLRAPSPGHPLLGGTFHACGDMTHDKSFTEAHAQPGDVLALRLSDGRLQAFRVLCAGGSVGQSVAFPLEPAELVAEPAPEVVLAGVSPIPLH